MIYETIEIRNDEIDDATAFDLVSQVISQGKISGGGTCYCYITIFESSTYGEITVSCDKKKSYIFKLWISRKLT